MIPIIVGIAGGTGAGKSTVCFGLMDKYPDRISIVHLDDYHKKRVDVPLLCGFTNWDCPEAVDFTKLLTDLKNLKHGQSIIVQTKNSRTNPLYNGDDHGRLPMIVGPKEYILLEGYLALYDSAVRSLLDAMIYLDINHKTRIKRRTKFMNKNYEEKVLIPMHEKYVQPTKQFSKVIDVTGRSQKEVQNEVESMVFRKTIPENCR